MKNLSFRLIYICLFYFGFISVVQSADSKVTELKILPYIEADVDLDSSDGDEMMTWATRDKLLFGTYMNSYFSDPSCDGQKPRFECKKPTFDRTKILMVFDINTQKTTFNIKNEYQESQLELINQQLYWENYTCPYEKKEGGNLKARYTALRPIDGCIKEIADDKNVVRKYTYVRPDGENFYILDRPWGDELRSWSWIDWLNVYLLRTHVSLSTTSEGNGKSYVSSPSSVIFLSPSTGKYHYIDVGEHEFSGASATRAGLIIYLDSNVNTNIAEEKQGLTLIQDNKNYVIAHEKGIYTTSVSPDGCQVAYLVPKRINEMREGYLQDITYSKLRIMNVCDGFGIAKDANPFATLLK